MSAKLRPIKNKVAVEFVEENEKKTAGGIYLPDTSDKEKPQTGKVVAVGTDEEVIKNIKVGDKIIFGKYAGTEVKVDTTKYLILNYEDILAVIE